MSEWIRAIKPDIPGFGIFAGWSHHLHAHAAIGTIVNHRADATIQVAGESRQVDLHHRTADSGIAQPVADVITLFCITEVQTVAVGVLSAQGSGQRAYTSDVFGTVVKHLHGLQTRGSSSTAFSQAACKVFA